MPKEIAPRLYNGKCRINWGGGLPENIKEGLKLIARKENRSVSWVMERLVIEYFNLPRPRYITDSY
jgi:hypothetical protein